MCVPLLVLFRLEMLVSHRHVGKVAAEMKKKKKMQKKKSREDSGNWNKKKRSAIQCVCLTRSVNSRIGPCQGDLHPTARDSNHHPTLPSGAPSKQHRRVENSSKTSKRNHFEFYKEEDEA